MSWGFVLLALAGCYSFGISYYLYQKTYRTKFLGLFFGAGFFVLINLAGIFKPIIEGATFLYIVNHVINWGVIFCLAFVLSSLLLFVRESKPEFSRFPISYAVFPLLIIISYLFVLNTVALKHWLINLYEGGAVVAALLIYGIYSYRDEIYRIIFAGCILFLITFLLNILLSNSYLIITQIVLTLSIFTTFSGYFAVENYYTNEI